MIMLNGIDFDTLALYGNILIDINQPYCGDSAVHLRFSPFLFYKTITLFAVMFLFYTMIK